MSVSYATRSDVLAVGVPRGALARPARLIKSVDTAANVLELEGHGFNDGDSLELTVSGPGVLPAPLATTTVYYAKTITLGDGTIDENRFQVSATKGGAAIDLTTAGTAPFAAAVPIGPELDEYLEQFSRWADAKLTNHVVPLTAPFPSWVTRIVALRTAVAILAALGRSMPTLATREQAAIADFLTLAKAPLRDARATAPANTAVNRTAVGSVASTRGTIP